MVGRFCECVGLVVVGSVRRGLTSSRHSVRKIHRKHKQWYSGFDRFLPPSHPNAQEKGGGGSSIVV